MYSMYYNKTSLTNHLHRSTTPISITFFGSQMIANAPLPLQQYVNSLSQPSP